MVLSCLTSAGSFAAPDLVGTIRRDSRLTLKKVKSDCFRRSLPIRTSENINAKGNISPFWALRCQGWTLVKATRCFHAGLLEDRRFRHGFSDWLWRRSSVTVCEAHILPWQSQCRSTHQRRSRHFEKATWCSHAWLLQDLSLRLISLARFRLIPSVSEGYIPRIPPRSSTRRTITKKKHHWVFQSRSRMKDPEAAAASQQLARYRRCLVLVQATALGNHSETVFLRQVCFLNWRGPGSWGRDLCPQQMNRWWQAKETEVKASVNPWEIEKIFIKFWRGMLSSSIQGENKLRKIIRDWSWCGN